MSLKRNIIANYASQIYIILVAILMVPIYVQYLGVEAYGLVGFFALLQSMLQLMDMGLSSTLSRQVASHRAGGLTTNRLNSLHQSLAGVFLATGLFIAALTWYSSEWVALSWLNISGLSVDLVADCVALMGAAAAFRWLSGLYRGIVIGWEQQVWLGWFNTAIATVRFVLIIPVFIWLSDDPRVFFTYQLLVAVAELLALYWKAGTLLGGVRKFPQFKLEPLRAVWNFSGAMALSSIVWILITQTDKLVLSKTLPLVDYGYFTMAAMLAGGVLLLANPISNALLPRLTYLVTEQDTEGFRTVYRNATQWVSVIVWPTAGAAAFFSEPLIYAWTGDLDLVHRVAPILFWYALGNACLAVSAFQFYLQFSHGKLKLHAIGNVVFLVILVPAIMWTSINYGAVGAGRMWFGINLFFLLTWTLVVHRQFVPGLHFKWLRSDVLPIAIGSVCVSSVLGAYVDWSDMRILLFVQLIACGIITLVVATLLSPSVRNGIVTRWFRKKDVELT